MRRRFWVAANSVMALAFAFSIIVQLNDPDPIRWIAIYALALTACVLELMERGHWSLAAVTGMIAGLWAVALSPRVLGQVPFMDMFGAFEMKNVEIEISREMYGLFGIMLWMVVLLLAAARRGSRGELES